MGTNNHKIQNLNLNHNHNGNANGTQPAHRKQQAEKAAAPSNGTGATAHDSASGSKDTVEVLYQRLGNRWFAFSLIDDELFVGSVSMDEIESAESRSLRIKKVIGNS